VFRQELPQRIARKNGGKPELVTAQEPPGREADDACATDGHSRHPPGLGILPLYI